MDSITPIRHCPICGSNEYDYKYSHSYELIDSVNVLGAFNVVICAQCHMTYADKIPNQKDIDFYYIHLSKHELSEPKVSEREIKLADYICAQSLGSDASIVDIGCAGGGLLIELKQRGYNSVAGVELSERNCKILSSAGIRTVNKSLFDLETGDFPVKIDCIILCAVMEHVSDLHLAVSIISKLLKQNGTVVISVPNLDDFFDSYQYPFEQLSMEHVNYFNLHSLDLLMRQHGFELDNKRNYDLEFAAAFKRTISIKTEMQEYVRRSSSYLEPSFKLIDGYAQSQKPVVIYGAGTLCRYLLANTRLSECNIIKIVDGNVNYHERTISARIIEPPSVLRDCDNINIEILVVTYHFFDEISKDIRDMGLRNPIIGIPVST